MKALRVTVLDLVNGDTETQDIDDGDYLLITTEPCWLDSTQVYKGGQTHVLTVKGRTA